MPVKRTVFLNGAFKKVDNRAPLAADPEFLSGPGVFETMRSCRGKIVLLDEHLKRLKRSAPLVGLKLNFSQDKLKTIVRKTVRLNSFRDAYVRLTIWRSEGRTGILAAAQRYEPYSSLQYKKGFSACISSVRQLDPDSAKIKSVNRILYDMALKEARMKGCDEAVILNEAGEITEGARSNIFLVKDGQLLTPLLECGCLDGITRRAVLGLAKKKKIKAREGAFMPQELLSCDEAFLTNSLMGIMPFSFLDRTRIGKPARPVTELLMKEYNALFKK